MSDVNKKVNPVLLKSVLQLLFDEYAERDQTGDVFRALPAVLRKLADTMEEELN